LSAHAPITVDGTAGGQSLRTALTLSLVTQRPFRVESFCAARIAPGLRPRHLALLRAAEALGGRVEGGQAGALAFGFHPRPVAAGNHVLELGASAPACLVFQCLFFPLALAGGGELRLVGLTHAPKGPTYHHLAWVWLPLLEAYGLRAALSLQRAGFWPEGVGEFRGEVQTPSEPPLRVEVPARGTLQDVEVRSLVGGVPFDVAARQARAAENALRERGIYSHAENLPLPVGKTPGTLVFIRAQFENTFAAFAAVGDRGAAPEEVGTKAAHALADFMQSPGALDEHLADQILLPAGLLAAGLLGASSPATTRFTAARLTPHLRVTAALLEAFLPVKVEVKEEGEVTVLPRAPDAGAPLPA
jgi:RNA 3'-terminal phosphate cyclase (ATP)